MMIQTVTGPIPVENLGRTLVHEHIFFVVPGAEFDPLEKFERTAFVEEAVRRLVKLRSEHGVRSLVDPCQIEIGRDVTLMKEVSEKSGMQIICTTGFYYEQLGLPIYWRARTVDEIADLYIREIIHGIGDTGVRAGAIVVGTSAPVATEFEKKFLAAACIAHKATNAPIITHTTNGLAGPEQQELFAVGGVEAHRCLIGHSCCNVDPAYHRRIVDAGSYIGFDQIGKFLYQPDEIRADNLAKLVRDGFREQITMSTHRWCGRLGKSGIPATPELLEKIKLNTAQRLDSHMFTNFIPMLHARGVSQADIDSILEDNPRRFFAGEPRPQRAAH
ncbi:phosphotriesterase family protein [Bradyrhizobium zhanjiangense]|uniref:Phosphotriesterase-related protein n=1 Tax=Bradyrhizobium zhanjiangense TaxID=1325107 RepID=A0ABY0D8B8_9BRAD|nr:phosphotriesterase-related protein [Bradyrhizobium zhanjiangense]RXG84566.1 phosphotriesterase-related protein [Bradyrhizobium zhanjiangense]